MHGEARRSTEERLGRPLGAVGWEVAVILVSTKAQFDRILDQGEAAFFRQEEGKVGE